MRNEFKFCLFFMFVFIVIASPAYGYLDPGTGSVILQGVLGGLAAVAVILKLYWHRLLKFFGLRKDTAKQSEYKKSISKVDNTR